MTPPQKVFDLYLAPRVVHAADLLGRAVQHPATGGIRLGARPATCLVRETRVEYSPPEKLRRDVGVDVSAGAGFAKVIGVRVQDVERWSVNADLTTVIHAALTGQCPEETVVSAYEGSNGRIEGVLRNEVVATIPLWEGGAKVIRGSNAVMVDEWTAPRAFAYQSGSGLAAAANLGIKLDVDGATFYAGNPLHATVSGTSAAFVLVFNVVNGTDRAEVLVPNAFETLASVRPEAPSTLPTSVFVDASHSDWLASMPARSQLSTQHLLAYAFTGEADAGKIIDWVRANSPPHARTTPATVSLQDLEAWFDKVRRTQPGNAASAQATYQVMGKK